MKLKKRLEFKPKKVRSDGKHKKVHTDWVRKAEKIPHGGRFGHRWFPYDHK